jgi:molybdopterin/thiamine biosynthesis adenylyltransferase
VTAAILLVGAGGIGAPAAIALAAAGLEALDVADDDAVETGNLHRQLLFDDADVGKHKLDAFAGALAQRAPAMRVGAVRARATPTTALDLVRGRRVVIDATDNFPSRFVLADACGIAGVAVVHAAAVRWHATVMAVPADGRPCYRCLFEEPPAGDAPDCASAGVAGPVCGVAGAIAADRALRLLAGDATAVGHVVTFDGRRDRLRAVAVAPRPACPLCGERRSIRAMDPSRYQAAAECTAADRTTPAGDPAWRPTSASPRPFAR